MSSSINSRHCQDFCPARNLLTMLSNGDKLGLAVLCLLLGKKATAALLLGTNFHINRHMLFNDQQQAISKSNLASGAWAGNGRRSLCVNTQLLLQSIINHTVLQCVWQDSFAVPVRQTISSDSHQLSIHRCHTVSLALLTVWAGLQHNDYFTVGSSATTEGGQCHNQMLPRSRVLSVFAHTMLY